MSRHILLLRLLSISAFAQAGLPIPADARAAMKELRKKRFRGLQEDRPQDGRQAGNCKWCAAENCLSCAISLDKSSAVLLDLQSWILVVPLVSHISKCSTIGAAFALPRRRQWRKDDNEVG
jgi:hypothetical protein